MRIVKVRIQNFKIYKDKTFEFPDERVILLTGGNGFGKTTLIDAIEWCLTGNIGRISNCYMERYHQKSEINRKENKSGIIKNSQCKKNEFVKVSLLFKIDDEIVEVYREQIEDDLFIDSELQFNKEVSKEKKMQIINAINNDKFYKYHLCDSYKTYNFLTCNRQEIKEIFQEFINDRPEIKMFKKNIELVKSYSENEISKLNASKVSDEIIKEKKEKLLEIKGKIHNIEYPQVKFYKDENVTIQNEETKKIKFQLDQIKKCGYNVIYNKIDGVILWYKAKEKERLFKDIFNIITTKKEDINIALKNNYYDENLKKKLHDKKNDIVDLQKEIKNANNIEDIINLKIEEKYPKIKDYIVNNKEDILVLNKKIEGLNNQIKDKGKGNEIIKALSNLVADRNALFSYKNNGNNRCPLCSSDSVFKNIKYKEDLAKDAEDYLEKSNTNLSELKIKLKTYESSVQNKISKLKDKILEMVNVDLEKIKQEDLKYELYYKETCVFFEKVKTLNIKIDDKCIKSIQLANNANNEILSNSKTYIMDLELIRKILVFIEYGEDLKEINVRILEKLKLEIENFHDETIEILDFNFESFTQKIIYMRDMINNGEIDKLEKIINQYNSNNEEIDKEISKFNKYYKKANELIDSINKVNVQLEKVELTTVGPYLYKIFTKFIKHCKVGNFNFNRDNAKNDGGATFTDESGNNILNTLSEGQMGIFILAYFFANMFRRKDETLFRIYFIDDITNCMDDINVLSFIEVIKYQLSSDESVIDQVFFSTCDYNIKNLFIHKMKSFGIKVANYKFISYGKAVKVEQTI